MNRRLSLAVATILAVPTLSTAAPCVVGTLEKYIALGAVGCTVDNVRFTSFDYKMTIPGVPPSRIEVRPFSTVTQGGASSLKFTGMWSAPAGQRLDAVIRYNVSLGYYPAIVPTPRGRIGLSLGPDKIGGAGASVDVVERTEAGKLYVYDHLYGSPILPPGVKREDRLDFSPPSLLKSSETMVTVVGGTGGATLSYFASHYSIVRTTF
jgi:hypothetical protein